MYLEMPVESVSNKYDSLTNEEMLKKLGDLEQQLKEQQEKIEEQNKVIEEFKKQIGDHQEDISEGLGGEQGKDKSDNTQVDQDLNVDNVRFYMRGGRERLEKDNVLNVIKSLKDPYKSEIYEFVKNNNVLGLQKYLNGKIDAQEIDVSKLREALSTRRIWLNGDHILEDGKFGPQTLETIKFLVKESTGDSNGLSASGGTGTVDTGTGGSTGTVDTGTGGSTGTVDTGTDGSTKGTGGEESSQEYEGNLPFGIALTIKEHIDNNENLSKLLTTGYSGEAISLQPLGDVLMLNLDDIPDGDKYTRQSAIHGFRAQFNIKKCLSSDGKIIDGKLSEVISDTIKEVVDKKKADVVYNFIKDKEYTKEEVFGNGNNFGGDMIKTTKISNFFRKFRDKLKFSINTSNPLYYASNIGKGTKIEGENIKLWFISGDNLDRWDKNPDLIFSCADVVDSNYNVKEDKLMQKLGNVIEKIVEKK